MASFHLLNALVFDRGMQGATRERGPCKTEPPRNAVDFDDQIGLECHLNCSHVDLAIMLITIAIVITPEISGQSRVCRTAQRSLGCSLPAWWRIIEGTCAAD